MERLTTGIKNLDRILKGGIPLYSVNLIAGAPGSGKTIFVQNIVFNCSRKGLKTVYLTTISESQFKMVKHLREFEFYDNDLLGDKFIYRDLAGHIRKEGWQKTLEYIDQIIKEHRPNILVIDSFKAIRNFFPSEQEFRSFVFELAARLSIWEITVFLVGEYEEEEVTTLSEFAIADGIFYLYGGEERKFQKRYLRILKMRGTDFEQGEHLFQISSTGILLFPRLKPSGKELEYKVTSDEREGFGIPELDEMLSGGVKRGTLTAVSGGTGTGKTIFSLQFIIEGANKGKRGLYLSFEEPVSQLKTTAQSLGWDIDKLVTKGLVSLKFISPIELDVDKHIYEIIDDIEKNKIERFVMDSVTAFERAVDIQKYKDYLWALTQHLKMRNITSIFTVMIDNPFSQLVASELGISSIFDNIIFLRYVEEGSTIKRILGILKGRGIPHSKDLREFEITPEGIKILKKLDIKDMLK